MASVLISSILTLGAKLVGTIQISPSDSSSSLENDLRWIMRTLERIQATLSDAEEMEIREEAVKLWLKELKEVAYDAEDVLGEYNYEVTRAKVEARGEATADSRKRKQPSSSSSSSPFSIRVQIPDGIAERIKAIRSRFDEIAEARKKLKLRAEDGSRRPNSTRIPPPTSHLIDYSNIFGRAKEKEEVIDLLLSQHGKKVPVIAIIGKGGLGKTTLAKLVFNDLRIRQRFDKRGWMCVSEDFDVKRLTKAMIESITGNSYDLTELSALQENLINQLRGKKVLLVLDDVWNEKQSLWESLRAPLVFAETAMILVTTRNVPVANIMRSVSPYLLGYLPEDQCWSLFQHYAFGRVYTKNNQTVEIGMQITRKCGGLPLAVKSLASLLRFVVNEDGWRDILESDEWSQEETLAALEISYQRMPAHLKPCFRFFSMFPKDYKFVKDELFKLWMAQGYLQSQGTKPMEEVASEYVDELISRSFLDHHHSGDYTSYGEDVSSYKMHDVIHDLARKTSGEEHFLVAGDYLPNLPDGVRHLHVRGNVGPLFSRNLTALRTLVVHNPSDISCLDQVTRLGDLANSPCLTALVLKRRYMMEFPDSIRNLKNLRYLQLHHSVSEMVTKHLCVLYNLQILVLTFMSLPELPQEIGNLQNLQYLKISYSNIEKIPESFCLLSTLQILILNHCELQELPEGLGNLVNLQHLAVCNCQIEVLPESICQLNSLQKLILYGCKRLRDLPSAIGDLRNLRYLNLVDSGVKYMPLVIHKLTALQRLKPAQLVVRINHNRSETGLFRDLVNRKGRLCISRLENMVSAEDAKNANLKSNCNLSELTLSWKNESGMGDTLTVQLGKDTHVLAGLEIDGQILEFLQSHPTLKKLTIKGYCGTAFLSWMADASSCASLKSICIEGCGKVRSLHFCNLSSISSLTISNCNQLLHLPEGSLPSRLQDLCINFCTKLKSLDDLQNLMSLERLDLSYCFQLNISPNSSLPAKLMTQHIMIFRCPSLTEWCHQHNIEARKENVDYERHAHQLNIEAHKENIDYDILSHANYHHHAEYHRPGDTRFSPLVD
ncbi:LOW QUALITY PROTEIN: putative disease resistance RPP13-like protein 1 [Typha latifolia]|uniref:LOW QUALITY PROTEIN: putative disease resistance RPP13-like protein 1 n=1 Tax=Typha latifolia TaxID=4733 RepID=UPI003C2B1BD1